MADFVSIGGRPVGRLGQLPQVDPLELARMREQADADAAEDKRHGKRTEFTLENLLRGYQKSGGYSGGTAAGYGRGQAARYIGKAIGQADYQRRLADADRLRPTVRPAGLDQRVHINPEIFQAIPIEQMRGMVDLGADALMPTLADSLMGLRR